MAQDLFKGIRKLTDPAEQMGERFQAICLSSPDLPAASGILETPYKFPRQIDPNVKVSLVFLARPATCEATETQANLGSRP